MGSQCTSQRGNLGKRVREREGGKCLCRSYKRPYGSVVTTQRVERKCVTLWIISTNSNCKGEHLSSKNPLNKVSLSGKNHRREKKIKCLNYCTIPAKPVTAALSDSFGTCLKTRQHTNKLLGRLSKSVSVVIFVCERECSRPRLRRFFLAPLALMCQST